jgi:hypothetical protein
MYIQNPFRDHRSINDMIFIMSFYVMPNDKLRGRVASTQILSEAA